MILDANTVLKTYTDIQKINEGAIGIIYRAYYVGLRKDVILKGFKHKKTNPGSSTIAKKADRRREVDTLKNLSHQYLPQVYSYFTIVEDIKLSDNNVLLAGEYTVMDFIPGVSLSKKQEDNKKMNIEFSQADIVKWSLQILDALEYIHSQRPPVIHCDIKPANIMLRPNGTICLIDFNIAFFLTQNPDFIGNGSFGYSAPEISDSVSSKAELKRLLLQNPEMINERIDIFGLGATLYSLAVGNNIKKGFDYNKLCAKMGEPYAKVIQKAISVNPDDRYQSAKEMKAVIMNLSNSDNEYTALLKRQKITRTIYSVGLIASILLCAFSIHGIRQTKLDEYYDTVDQQIAYREQQDYDNEEKKYNEAVELNESNLQAYYQHAYSLYCKGDYADCINFINAYILGNEKIKDNQDNSERVYYILADSYYQLNLYDKSIETYKDLFNNESFDKENFDSVFYRDYAVALAKSGDLNSAKEVIEDAKEAGLEEDSLYYVTGEIDMANNSSDVVADMNKVISTTQDEELKQRAYVSLANYYRDNGNLDNAKTTLEKASQDLDTKYQIQVTESLAQVYIDLANKYNTASYRTKAIEQLNKVINQNWDTYETYNTLSILYEKNSDYTSAAKILGSMKDKYGEDYNYYKRMAYIELDKQQATSTSSRDYSKFKEYYNKAVDLYDGSDDQEMVILEQNCSSLISKGW